MFTLSTKARAEVARDVTVFFAALVATGVLDGQMTRDTVIAAVVTAAKVAARQIFTHPEV